MAKTPVSVQELDELLEKLSAKEKEIDAQKEILTAHNKEYNQLQFRASAYIQELGRDEYSGPAGKIEIKEKWRVTLPVSDNDKSALFAHLRERGLFDKYATVNSNSLNALYNADWDEAKRRGEGMVFTMPGVGAPVIDRLPKFTAAKVKKIKD